MAFFIILLALNINSSEYVWQHVSKGVVIFRPYCSTEIQTNCITFICH